MYRKQTVTFSGTDDCWDSNRVAEGMVDGKNKTAEYDHDGFTVHKPCAVECSSYEEVKRKETVTKKRGNRCERAPLD